MRLSIPTTIACALLAACQAPSMHPVTRTAPPPEHLPAAAPTNPVEAQAQKPVLYGRDGKPVGDGSPERGAVSPRDAQGQEGGRLTLLELYQKALERRDALEREVAALQTDLEATHKQLAAAQAEIERLKQGATGQDGERERLAAENQELAARLATAHIRRMEAEKALLELKLESQRARPAAAPVQQPVKAVKQ